MTLPVLTAAQFVAMFPEFTNVNQVTNATVFAAISGLAPIYVSEAVFPPGQNGNTQLYAQGLVTAHFIKLDQLHGGGSITSERVGEVADTQAALPANAGQFNQTTYGQRFLSLGRIFRIPTTYAGGGSLYPIPPFSFPQQTWTR